MKVVLWNYKGQPSNIYWLGRSAHTKHEVFSSIRKIEQWAGHNRILAWQEIGLYAKCAFIYIFLNISYMLFHRTENAIL